MQQALTDLSDGSSRLSVAARAREYDRSIQRSGLRLSE